MILRSYRFPDRTPEELGESPVLADGFILETKWYDKAGNLVRKEDYEADGAVNECDEFLFNDQNLIVEHRHFMAGDLTETNVITYTDKGLPLREERTFAEGGKQITEYTYDAGGHLLRKTLKDESGEEEGYDAQVWEKDQLVKRESRDLLMESGDEHEYQYDESGTLKEEKQTEIPSGMFYRTVYSSDGYVTYDSKGSRFASHKKVLNEQGKILESHYSTMQRDVSSFYTYDPEGRLAEEKRRVGEHEQYHARYFYDSTGNVLKVHVTEASSGTFTDLFLREENQES